MSKHSFLYRLCDLKTRRDATESEKSGQPTALRTDPNVVVTEMERGDCSEYSRSTKYKYQNLTYFD
jgi:hypothetical protein